MLDCLRLAWFAALGQQIPYGTPYQHAGGNRHLNLHVFVVTRLHAVHYNAFEQDRPNAMIFRAVVILINTIGHVAVLSM